MASVEKGPTQIRTIDQISEQQEWLLWAQREGRIDSKAGDALNTTLKGIMELRVKIPIKYVDMMLKASIKKVALPKLPKGLLPAELESLISEASKEKEK